jgi:hypothetical protein
VEIVVAVDPYDKNTKRGVTLNNRTLEMFEVAELKYLMNTGLVPLTLSQGSYTSANPSSGGTHDGGGALDVKVANFTTRSNYTDAQRKAIELALRKMGFAAWIRNPNQGNWPWHIHAIAIGDKQMSSAAAQQVIWYKQGLNGLWPPTQGPDTGPDVTWTEYRQDVDLSYYGFEHYDADDWKKYLSVELGDVTLPDGRTVSPNIGQALRAAYWLRYRLAEGVDGADKLAREMFSADGIFRNQSVEDETSPSARGPLTWFISDLEATQDADHQKLADVAADVTAIKDAVTSSP